MSGWRDRLVAAPLVAIFLYFALGFAALTFLLAGRSKESVAPSLVGGLLFGILMTSWTAVARRRDRAAAGGENVARQVAIARALRTGTAPDDRSWDQALRGLIERRRAQLRWASRANPIVFGAFTVLAVALALTGDAVAWLYAIANVGILILLSRSTARSRLRLANLEAELNARAVGSS